MGTGKVPGEDEDEMTVLHEGGKVVCIEGESLWVVLRLSNGSNRLSSKTPVHVFCATGRSANFWVWIKETHTHFFI